MPTNRPRIAGYVHQYLRDELDRYKVQHRVGDSEAINRILKEYFFGDAEHSFTGTENAIDRLCQLETRVLRLSKIVTDLLEQEEHEAIADE